MKRFASEVDPGLPDDEKKDEGNDDESGGSEINTGRWTKYEHLVFIKGTFMY